MRESIFHTEVEMPPKSNSPDVVRTALTRGEMRRDLMPPEMSEDKSVRNLPPVNRGHHY